MSANIDWIALTVFVFFFALVTVMGFFAARWKSGPVTEHLDEWGLGGRQFGTWITWFLVGGDFYTAYTVIAVPALVYAVGAYGFFALPYTIVVYPFVFAIMPLLWKVAHAKGHVTAADVVHGTYSSRGLELAVAITGIVATMPYIALQLVGMDVVIKALGLTGELPIVAAFVILALYTYSSGLRAPALIAFVKDIMIYIVVLVAVVVVPAKLGGYAHGVQRGQRGIQRQGRCDRSGPEAVPDARLCNAGAWLGAGRLHVSAHADRNLRLQVSATPSARMRSCCRPIRCCSG